jgi:glycosyltransferase involved in cell wall biosynthesis
MDAFAWGLGRRRAFERGVARAVLGREEALMRRYEREAFGRFDAHTVITAADRDRLAVPDTARVRVVGNGVDATRFAPREMARDYDLLFVGNLAYPPNVKAAEILVHDVLPRVQARRPACRVLIAGTSPGKRVRRLAGPSVDLSGWVDDIAPCYARSRVFVAPLVMGTGLPNKLLQAMAMGLPCVTTTAAREAVGAGDAQVRAADDPGGIAAEVAAILEDDGHAAHLGDAGRRLVAERFRWEQAVAPLADLLIPAAVPGAAAAPR